MLNYNLFLMNRFSGHIDRCQTIDALDDASARRAACEYIGTQPMELWLKHRKVQRFEASGDIARFDQAAE
jgi:hypothetical protein